MEPKEQFGVIIRTIGLLALIASVLVAILGLADHAGQLLAESLVLLAIGVILLAAPSEIADGLYRKKASDESDG